MSDKLQGLYNMFSEATAEAGIEADDLKKYIDENIVNPARDLEIKDKATQTFGLDGSAYIQSRLDMSNPENLNLWQNPNMQSMLQYYRDAAAANSAGREFDAEAYVNSAGGMKEALQDPDVQRFMGELQTHQAGMSDKDRYVELAQMYNLTTTMQRSDKEFAERPYADKMMMAGLAKSIETTVGNNESKLAEKHALDFDQAFTREGTYNYEGRLTPETKQLVEATFKNKQLLTPGLEFGRTVSAVDQSNMTEDAHEYLVKTGKLKQNPTVVDNQFYTEGNAGSGKMIMMAAARNINVPNAFDVFAKNGFKNMTLGDYGEALKTAADKAIPDVQRAFLNGLSNKFSTTYEQQGPLL